jgi:hypothetical protein
VPDPWCDGILPDQEARIKRAVENTCELCHEYIPSPLLQLHGLHKPKKEHPPTPKEREKNILVVCEPCHALIHAEPVPEKKIRARIAARPFIVRKEILQALGYSGKPIIPPDDQDYARVYDDTINEFAGHYR